MSRSVAWCFVCLSVAVLALARAGIGQPAPGPCNWGKGPCGCDPQQGPCDMPCTNCCPGGCRPAPPNPSVKR